MSTAAKGWREPTEEEERNAPQVNDLTFAQALLLAWPAVERRGTGGDVGPLADWVASKAPLTRNDRLRLADLLRMLPSPLPRGARGPGKHIAFRRTEEARRVAEKQDAWRERNPTRKGLPRKSVPAAETEKIIREVVGPGCSDTDIEDLKRTLKNKSRL